MQMQKRKHKKIKFKFKFRLDIRFKFKIKFKSKKNSNKLQKIKKNPTQQPELAQKVVVERAKQDGPAALGTPIARS